MEAYPAEYVRHELPLIALSGLGENPKSSSGDSVATSSLAPGATILRELPEVSPQFARALQDGFYGADGSTFPWNGFMNPRKQGLIGFNFLSVGNKLVFPRRKAAPAAQTPSEEIASPLSSSPPVITELHSTLSPLSPTSPLFPDGLISPLWMSKHQERVPSVLLCFFELNTGASMAQDDLLRNEISRMRTALLRSGYRTRLAVAVLSETNSSEIEDRIANLRRTTGLDRSSFFALSDPQTQADIGAFILDTLYTLQTVCIDYYRDLTKHSRRKKNRGYVPAPAVSALKGTGQPLTLSGWNARYDFKQGIFAEFRQEMDAAERHFASALDELQSDDGVLMFLPVDSPRWEEGRCLADVIAVRVIRCLLWRSMTSGAAEFWSNYRQRTKALIDKRGTDEAKAGLAAWNVRWAQIMAELVSRANVPAFDIKHRQQSGADEEQADEYVEINISAIPEKTYTAIDRIPPFRILHHAGYWYRIAQQWAFQRYKTARNEDALLAPAEDDEAIPTLAIKLGEAAESEFAKRKQFRMRAHLALQRSRLLSENSLHEEAMQTLLSVWTDMKWRSEGWWDLTAEVLLALYETANAANERRIAIEVKWEMLSNAFGDSLRDQLKGIEGDSDAAGQAPLQLSTAERLSPITISFCFAFDEGHAGDVVPCQITIQSASGSTIKALTIKTIQIVLSGGVEILVSHESSNTSSHVQELTLEDSPSAENSESRHLIGQADLNIQDNATQALNFGLPLRVAGEMGVFQARVDATMDGFLIQQSYSPFNLATSSWWIRNADGLIERSLDRSDSLAIEVLPKPPRVQVQLSDPSAQYFTSEDVVIKLVIFNEESDAVQGSVNIDVPDDTIESLGLTWRRSAGTSAKEPAMLNISSPIPASEQREYELCFRTPVDPTTITLAFKASYTIGTDQDTVVDTTATFNFDLIQPIDVDFELFPRLHDESWPSFFALSDSTDDDHEKFRGIRQQWLLSARTSSHAQEKLAVEKLALVVVKTAEDVSCDIPPPPPSEETIVVGPSAHHELTLPFFTRRRSLDDRRPTPVSLELHASWRREVSPAAALSKTVIPVPTFQLPAAEPRVLCTASPLELESTEHAFEATPSGRLVTYTIENPSMHFLTFSLAMEASDQFAFSGPKLRNVSLTPLSRKSIEYRLLLLDTEAPEMFSGKGEDGSNITKGSRGKWVYPAVQVTDSYFNKSLRVSPAGHGVGFPKEGAPEAGIGIWVPLPGSL